MSSEFCNRHDCVIFTKKTCYLWYNLTKEVFFLPVAGFGIFRPHKILGALQRLVVGLHGDFSSPNPTFKF